MATNKSQNGKGAKNAPKKKTASKGKTQTKAKKSATKQSLHQQPQTMVGTNSQSITSSANVAGSINTSLSDSNLYTCPSLDIRLSKDALKLHLGNSYEKSRKDTSKFNFGKTWSAFISAAGSFFISFVTSFEPTETSFQFKNAFVSILFLVITLGCTIAGIFALKRHDAMSAKENVFTSRDKAVEEIITNDIKAPQ